MLLLLISFEFERSPYNKGCTETDCELNRIVSLTTVFGSLWVKYTTKMLFESRISFENRDIMAITTCLMISKVFISKVFISINYLITQIASVVAVGYIFLLNW